VNEVFKTESAGYLMNHIARQFAILLGEGLKPLGIAPAQFPILLELWQKDGLSQQELLERADLKEATIDNASAGRDRARAYAVSTPAVRYLYRRTKHERRSMHQLFSFRQKAELLP